MAKTTFGDKIEKMLKEHFEEPPCEHFGVIDIFSPTTDLKILKLREECPSCKREYETYLKRVQKSGVL